MSADNAILILGTKDEYYVRHAQAIDNLYWSWEDSRNEFIVPIRVFEFFHNIEPISRENPECDKKVLELANKLYEEIGYLEYGIITLSIQNTFKEVAYQAMLQAENEISHISKNKNLSEENKVSFTEDIRHTIENILEWVAKHG